MTRRSPVPQFLPGRARDNRYPNGWVVMMRGTLQAYGETFPTYDKCRAMCTALNKEFRRRQKRDPK